MAAGARIGVASRSQDKVDAAVARLSRRDAPARGFSLDVREPQAVADALASFVQSRGKIDVLVSGAAGNFPAAAASLSPNGFKSVVGIDLLGTFNVMRAAWPHLTRPGASVISICPAGDRPDGHAGACVRGQGRRGHGHQDAGPRVGA